MGADVDDLCGVDGARVNLGSARLATPNPCWSLTSKWSLAERPVSTSLRRLSLMLFDPHLQSQYHSRDLQAQECPGMSLGSWGAVGGGPHRFDGGEAVG